MNSARSVIWMYLKYYRVNNDRLRIQLVLLNVGLAIDFTVLSTDRLPISKSVSRGKMAPLNVD